METVECKRCSAIIGQRSEGGDVVRLQHGRDITTITNAASVTRICRKCGTENDLARARPALSAAR